MIKVLYQVVKIDGLSTGYGFSDKLLQEFTRKEKAISHCLHQDSLTMSEELQIKEVYVSQDRWAQTFKEENQHTKRV